MNRFIIRVSETASSAVHGQNGGISLHHLSDLHTWQPQYFSETINVKSLFKNNKWRDMKQIQGFLNVKYKRGPNLYQAQCLSTALKEINTNLKHSNGHLVITGDVTNIAHIEEFKRLRQILISEHHGNEEFIDELYKYYTMIPGNHDTYTPSSVSNNYFGKYFGDTLGFFLSALNSEENPFDKQTSADNYFIKHQSHRLEENFLKSLNLRDLFPNIKVLTNGSDTNVLVLSLLTCVPTKPFVAGGLVHQSQLDKASSLIEQMESALQETSEEKTQLFKVLLMHHPPIERAKNSVREYLDGLDKDTKQRIADFCGKEKINLLLHGHTHVPYQGYLENNGHKTIIIDNGSSTYVNEKNPFKMARFHTYHIKGNELVDVEQNVWNVSSQQFEKRILPKNF